jgi:hypothetical protein
MQHKFKNNLEIKEPGELNPSHGFFAFCAPSFHNPTIIMERKRI